jgi:hypothetical protein
MIPKKGEKNSPSNYRPISITSVLARLCEKLIKNRINKHLKENKIIVNYQSGFRKFRQTKDNLIHVIQKSIESFNRKRKIIALFFDISSAFDKVWHDGLLYKLEKIKTPTYLWKWICSFIDKRQSFVKVNTTNSNLFEIKTGVPQGAVLSPILFSIYINDIPSNIEKNKNYSLLFADDLAYYHMYNKATKNTLETHLNKHLKHIELWLRKWRLLMAPHKCNYIIFSNGKKSSMNLNIKLFEKNKPKCYNVKFLGIRLMNIYVLNIKSIIYIDQHKKVLK